MTIKQYAEVVCDRCGYTEKHDASKEPFRMSAGYLQRNYNPVQGQLRAAEGISTSADLCDSCVEDLRSWWKLR